LPCGNFDEDYGILLWSSMEKWQAGVKMGNFAEGMQHSAVVPAKAGTQVLLELSKRVQTWVPACAGTTI
jgi:hypothetical protein